MNDLRDQLAENNNVSEDVNEEKLIRKRFPSPIVDEYKTSIAKVDAETLYLQRGFRDSSKLGSGSFGVVFKVTRIKDGVEMAVKKCDMLRTKHNRELSPKEQENVRKKHFNDQLRELIVFKTVDSTHIPKLFDYFIIDDTFYIFMELAQHDSLHDVS